MVSHASQLTPDQDPGSRCIGQAKAWVAFQAGACRALASWSRLCSSSGACWPPTSSWPARCATSPPCLLHRQRRLPGLQPPQKGRQRLSWPPPLKLVSGSAPFLATHVAILPACVLTPGPLISHRSAGTKVSRSYLDVADCHVWDEALLGVACKQPALANGSS